MSVLESSWPHGGEHLSPWEPGTLADSDNDPGHLPEDNSELPCAQGVGVPPFPLRPTCGPSFGPLPTSSTWEETPELEFQKPWSQKEMTSSTKREAGWEAGASSSSLEQSTNAEWISYPDLEGESSQWTGDPEVMSLDHPGLDTDRTPNWPGLRALLQQLPPQDSDERYCLALGEEEWAELRLFCAQRRQDALGQGVAHLVSPKLEEHICEKCRERLRPGEYGVFAARAGERYCWHQACFACQACGQALIKLIYFYRDGRLYCGRHHAELLRPRCPACDQLIFSSRCTEAEGRRWHENHFCCQDCAGPLGGGRYALPGGGPCCPSCFESRYADTGSSPAPTLERRASLALLTAAASASPDTRRGPLGSSAERESPEGDAAEAPKGREQSCREVSLEPEEVAPCPTCSSSSDSEPEGFFLGQRLPQPGETPGALPAGDSDTPRKLCTVC